MRIDQAQLNVINKAKAWKRSKNQSDFEQRSHELHLAVEALETLEKMVKKVSTSSLYGVVKARPRGKRL